MPSPADPTRDGETRGDPEKNDGLGGCPDSYLEYLGELSKVNPVYGGFRDFFRDQPKTPTSQCTILDLVDGRVHRQRATRGGLSDRPTDFQTRLIVLGYPGFRGLDKQSLDDVSLAFDLDPLELWRHFDPRGSVEGSARFYEPSSSFQTAADSDTLISATQLASTERYFHFDARSGDPPFSMLVVFIDAKQCGHVDTVIVFYTDLKVAYFRPPGPNERPSARHGLSAMQMQRPQLSYEHYVDGLLGWDVARVKHAALNPVELVVPLLQIALDTIAQRLHKERFSSLYFLNPALARERATLFHGQEIYFHAYVYDECLARAAASLENVMQIHQLDSTPAVAKAFADMRTLREDWSRLRGGIKDSLAQSASIATMNDSQQSIAMARSVKTLTQLAFIFIPLNFGTSLFGINIIEFGTGTVPAWVFATTVAALGLGTASLAFLWSKRTPGWRDPLVVAIGNALTLIQFSLRSPVLAVVLALASVFKHPRSFRRDLDKLGIGDLGLVVQGTPYVCQEFFAPRPDVPFTEGLQDRVLHRVSRYTKVSGWERDRFYKPWVRRERMARLRKAESLPHDTAVPRLV